MDIKFTNEELKEALRAIDSTITKCEKVLPKLKEGTSQHTLLKRRIKALKIATSLIKQELSE
jgi:ribosome-associated translation inhibitor RaiA